MAERSGTIAAALFLMPSLCVISIRYGLPTVNEVISNDIIIEIGIHSLAVLIGIFMYVKYGVVEDHEYHRSAIIKRLSKSYSQEDKGLWDKSDNAMLKLEENAKSSIKGRKGQLVQAKMSGNIGSLNVESTEIEVNDDLDIEIVTHHRGVNTIIDENVLEDRIVKSRKSFITRRLEKSASKRIERKKIKQQRKKIKSNANVAKSNNNEGQDNHWDMPISSNLTKSVVPCIECGTLNNSTNPYCTSCGTYLS
ncbi:hypothetical protein OAV45_04415 [Candidatus Poseidoniales archaeon]|jgi:hypothetical protein|nr:hypothetical protein [Euryarchaeota archaeon]MDC3310650.1 hypothetical protein [Candidatus Poseidoniales archaeon]MDG1542717.1 hypothetical protein [Candidatus Thalassarchaeaceae archaeon]|tara:strand:- start:1483 stop:2235 length:753 start_codon:yes stop_codon:yes gene_type:complete